MLLLSAKGSLGVSGAGTRCSSSNGVTNGSTAREECRACVVVNKRVTGVEVSGFILGGRGRGGGASLLFGSGTGGNR